MTKAIAVCIAIVPAVIVGPWWWVAMVGLACYVMLRARDADKAVRS